MFLADGIDPTASRKQISPEECYEIFYRAFRLLDRVTQTERVCHGRLDLGDIGEVV